MFERGSNNKINVRGEKTDLWALGITLFYMISGRTPYDSAKNPMELKDMIVNEEINFDLITHIDVRSLL